LLGGLAVAHGSTSSFNVAVGYGFVLGGMRARDDGGYVVGKARHGGKVWFHA
jgi:hypothetical protein